jgi:hypothetical protein
MNNPCHLTTVVLQKWLANATKSDATKSHLRQVPDRWQKVTKFTFRKEIIKINDL